MIKDVKNFDNLIRDSKNKGKTFEVSRDVFMHYSIMLKIHKADQAAIDRINRVLKTNIVVQGNLGLSRSCSCVKCIYTFNFADYVEFALKSKHHSVNDIKKFIDGGSYFLTIDSDKNRPIECPNCGNMVSTPHCCYTTSYYAYTS